MWKSDTYFEVETPSPWSIPAMPSELQKPDWYGDIDKKVAFATRLGKGDRPLDAALFVFEKQSDALQAVQLWSRDPLVVETREKVESETNLLDKDALSRKLLKFADEKTPAGNPIHESKDRIAAYKLYAEIQGYIGKINIDASQKTFNSNAMTITLVEAEQEQKTEIKTIEHRELAPLDNVLDIDLKLVG